MSGVIFVLSYGLLSAATDQPDSMRQAYERRLPIRFIPHDLVIYENTSHWACRKYIDIFADLNTEYCPNKGTASERVRAVYSWGAERCEGEWAGHCDAKFLCRVKTAYRGCSASFLQSGLIGMRAFFCYDGKYAIIEDVADVQRSRARCQFHGPENQPQAGQIVRHAPPLTLERRWSLAEQKHYFRRPMNGADGPDNVEGEDDDQSEEYDDLADDEREPNEHYRIIGLYNPAALGAKLTSRFTELSDRLQCLDIGRAESSQSADMNPQ